MSLYRELENIAPARFDQRPCKPRPPRALAFAPGTVGTEEASRIVGASPRQLQWWDEQKIVSPIQLGHQRRYTKEQLRVLYFVRETRKRGFSLHRIKGFMQTRDFKRECRYFVIGKLRRDSMWGADSPAEAMTIITKLRGPVCVIEMSA